MGADLQLSVVMPIYNGVPFLKDAINDLLCQTYKDFELICVDDGSQDKSLDVIKYYANGDDRIIYISQPNCGAGNARNKGLSMASGKYVIFLDCDDRYAPSFFESMLRKADETDADIVLCDASVFDNYKYQPMDSSWVLRKAYLVNDTFAPEDIDRRIFNITSGMPWNKMFRRQFIIDENIEFENIQYWNDTYFSFVLLASAKKIAVIDEELVHYRMNRPGAITSAFKGKNVDIGLTLLVTIMQELKRRDIYAKYWIS